MCILLILIQFVIEKLIFLFYRYLPYLIYQSDKYTVWILTDIL